MPAKPLAALFEDKMNVAQKAGIDLQEIDLEARRIVESNIATFFDVSTEVISRRMSKDKLWS